MASSYETTARLTTSYFWYSNFWPKIKFGSYSPDLAQCAFWLFPKNENCAKRKTFLSYFQHWEGHDEAAEGISEKKKDSRKTWNHGINVRISSLLAMERWKVQIIKLLIVEPSPLPILIPLRPKYSPRILFSNTLSLHSSFYVRDHVLQPYTVAQMSIFFIDWISLILKINITYH